MYDNAYANKVHIESLTSYIYICVCVCENSFLIILKQTLLFLITDFNTKI